MKPHDEEIPTMRITIHPATSEDIKFDTEFDIFKRKDFGERLANLIQYTRGSAVFALDSAWGDGKTTFIKMWIKYLHERGMSSIYFDAFANDYQKDPFIAIASEIYGLIPADQSDEQKEFTTKLLAAGYAFARGALDVSLKLATNGALGLDVATTAIADYKGQSSSEVIKQAFIDKLKFAAKDKQSLAEFRVYLEKFAKEIGNSKPIVFIIDELDRCRPDFALDILEMIKHLFSVDGITFLLVTNRVQLDEFIKFKYGSSINATNYLHKFINLWLELPKKIDRFDDYNVKYFQYALPKIIVGPYFFLMNLKAVSDSFIAIIVRYRPSYREIERMLSIFSTLLNMAHKIFEKEQFLVLTPLICYLKACRVDVLPYIKNKELDHALTALDISDELHHLYNPYLGHIIRCIKYDLGGPSEKDAVKGSLGANHGVKLEDDVMQRILLCFSGIKEY